jgi:tetratricopeptide (TPR) repeat protein
MKTKVIGLVVLTLGLCSSAAFGQVTRADVVTLQKGQTYLKAKNYKAAIKTMEGLLKQVPNYANAYRLLGHAYYEDGQLKEARRNFIEAFQRGCLESDVLGRLAQMDQSEKRFPSLINILRLLMITNPAEQSWRILYADVLLTMGELDEAEALFKILIKANPSRRDFYLRFGNLALRRGQLKEAATAFETAYHLGELEPQLPGKIAGLWYELERWRDALAWYDRASRVQAKQKWAYALKRGQLLFRIGEFDSARKLLLTLTGSKDKAIAQSSSLLLGQIAKRGGALSEAVSHWQGAFESGYRDGKLLKFLGLHFFKAKDYVKASKYLALTGADVRDVLVHRALIAALIRSGNENEARSQLLSYLERSGLDRASRALIREFARK